MTGYFTYAHFVNLENRSLLEDVKNDFKYIKRKFSKFLPYTCFTVFASLMVRHVMIQKDFRLMMIPKAVLESFMLIRGDSNVGVLWYLCALLWVLPFFCLSCRLFNKRMMFALSLLGITIFYGFIKIYSCFAPIMFARAFAGLLLGAVVFGLSQKLNKLNINPKLLKCIAAIFLIVPIVLTVMNIEYDIAIIFSFIIGFACVLSHSNTSEFWGNKIWSYLGKWSFSLYLVHLNMADLVCWISKNIISLKITEQYLIYVILTAMGIFLLEVAVKYSLRVTTVVKKKLNIVKTEAKSS